MQPSLRGRTMLKLTDEEKDLLLALAEPIPIGSGSGFCLRSRTKCRRPASNPERSGSACCIGSRARRSVASE